VSQGRVLETHLLDRSGELGVAALDRVGHQGPGGADEANQSGLAVSLLP
jgi:hypothetical protein